MRASRIVAIAVILLAVGGGVILVITAGRGKAQFLRPRITHD